MNDHNYTPSFFYYYTATTKIYPLSLHDALPIYVLSALVFHDRSQRPHHHRPVVRRLRSRVAAERARLDGGGRSEEHTSELQSQFHLVCRLLLEKKKKKSKDITI